MVCRLCSVLSHVLYISVLERDSIFVAWPSCDKFAPRVIHSLTGVAKYWNVWSWSMLHVVQCCLSTHRHEASTDCSQSYVLWKIQDQKFAVLEKVCHDHDNHRCKRKKPLWCSMHCAASQPCLKFKPWMHTVSDAKAIWSRHLPSSANQCHSWEWVWHAMQIRQP